MGRYYKLDKDGKKSITDIGSSKLPEGGSQYSENTPSFESLHTNAGRGKQGGPTAKELKKYEDKQDEGIFTEGKRMPPSPREMASGGTASSRADGIAQKGKTRGKMC